jgi:hypothetical protein
MPQVEDVTVARAVPCQDLSCFGAYCLRRRKQNTGIEIALKRDFGTDAFARITDVHGPIQADAIRTAIGQALEPQSPAFGEHSAGNDMTVVAT